MILVNISSYVKLGKNLLEPFEIIQGSSLSRDPFYLVMESVLRKVGVHRNSSIFIKVCKLLAYNDDVSTPLSVPNGMFLLPLSLAFRGMSGFGPQIVAGKDTFDVVKEIYLN